MVARSRTELDPSYKRLIAHWWRALGSEGVPLSIRQRRARVIRAAMLDVQTNESASYSRFVERFHGREKRYVARVCAEFAHWVDAWVTLDSADSAE